MPIQLSNKVKSLKSSASMSAKQRVDELEVSGNEILDFTLGEPDMNTPLNIVDSGIAAIKSGDTHYTGSSGKLSLRKAVCSKLSRDNNAEYSSNEIVIGSGAKQLISEAFSASLNVGDEVIIPAPYWVSYPDIVALNQGIPVIVQCGPENGFKLTAKQLESAITPSTRWLIINSPSNPTGAVYSNNEWHDLLAVLRRHPSIALMTDEIYEHIVYDGTTNHSPVGLAPDFKDRTLIVNGVSKAYAMTGWRIGFAAGPSELINAIAKLIGQSTSCPASFAQSATIEALTGSQDSVESMRKIYATRKEVMVSRLNRINGINCLSPDGAFYVFPDVGALIGRTTPEGKVLCSDIDITSYLLESAKVALMDGTSYGLPGFIRLSFATSTDIIERGCDAIERSVNELLPTMI